MNHNPCDNYLRLIFYVILFIAAETTIGSDMSEDIIDLPNYSSHDDSPVLEGLGIKIKLHERAIMQGMPLILRGILAVDEKFIRPGEDPLSRVLVFVIRRDEPEMWGQVVMDIHNVIPDPEPPSEDGDDVGSGLIEQSYFNLDLTQICEILEPGGRYWVAASLGDYVSNRLEFEILVQAGSI